ncbi:MAG: glycosyltransferase [Verrucomicrobiales bacterium]
MALAAIMTVHNGEPHLQEALNSLACQTTLPSEIVIFNDASTDRTLEILEASALPLKVIQSIRQVGAGAGRRIAVQAATQPMVMFLDADDRWHPDAVRNMLSAYHEINRQEPLGLFGQMQEFVDDSLDREVTATVPFRPTSGWHQAHIPGTLLTTRDVWLDVANTVDFRPGKPDFTEWYSAAANRGVRFVDCPVPISERRLWKNNMSRATTKDGSLHRVLKGHLDQLRQKSASGLGARMKGLDSYLNETMNDRWIMEHVFPGKRNGFFVEAGAANGKAVSSCYLLEHRLGWKGLCIEPHSVFFKELLKNRPGSYCENVALTDRACEVDFLEGNSRVSAYLSGIEKAVSNKETSNSPQNIGPIVKKTGVPLAELLDKHHAPLVIDYGAFDIEGSENAVLMSFPHDRYRFLALSVESDEPSWKKLRPELVRWGYRETQNPFNLTMSWERYCLHESIL